MPSGVNGVPWMQEGGAVVAAEEDEDGGGGGLLLGEIKDVPGFKPILDEDWYLAAGGRPNHGFESVDGYERQGVDDVTFSADPSPPGSMLLQPVDSSTSSSSPPPSIFDLEKSLPFFAQSSSISSLFSAVCSNPFDAAAFEQGYGAAFLPAAQMSSSAMLLNSGGGGGGGGGMLRFASLGPSGHAEPPDLIPAAQFQAPGPVPLLESGGFGIFDGSPFFHKSKVLQPLEICPPVGAPPTLFQKRAAAALRRRSPAPVGNGSAAAATGEKGWTFLKSVNGGDEGEADVDFPDLNYDSDEAAAGEGTVEENTNPGGDGHASNANSTVTGGDGDHKGKKKRMPAKNLMAERRRRKKLNDRLYMLRSVVPKISKMDRASILGDAIEYLNELLQRINDLHNELESTPCGSPLASVATASFHPLTPTLPCRVKDELCPSPLPSPCSQVPKVEVGEREGQGVNIHVLCARRPGLLFSTMKALDGLGLDIQQAVISCFNGFALDVFRAEQCKDGPGVRSEEIKAVLLHCVGCHDTT